MPTPPDEEQRAVGLGRLLGHGARELIGFADERIESVPTI